MQHDVETKRNELAALVERYAANRAEYIRPTYGETSLRVEFLDPLFCILGWDVNNEAGHSIYTREVIHEANVTVDDEDSAHANKKPDYAFRLGGETKFFLEAKKPSVNIVERREPSFQARRYGWNGNHAIAVLSNFEDLSIYDCGYRPTDEQGPSFARILCCHFDELVDHFEELCNILSKEAVVNGSLDNVDAREQAVKVPFDDLFLGQISSWRGDIALDIYNHYEVSEQDRLNEFTQTLLNRIIFLRVCEDRSFEDKEELLRIASFEGLRETFAVADAKYDSGLFNYLDDAPWKVSDHLLVSIFQDLYSPESSYDFNVVQPHVIGHIYEKFLSERVYIEDGRVRFESTPEAVESNGVVPTPKNITDAIVANALRDVSYPCKVADICCGSGNFLLSSYEHLVSKELSRVVSEGDASIELIERPSGPDLPFWRKRQILTEAIYGVDIERGAIDIARLRFWLSIVVDADKPEPLPNFDYKFMQGNSLIESFDGFDLSRIASRPVGRPSTSVQLTLGLDSHTNQCNLHRLIKDYFRVTDHQEKAHLRQQINDEVKLLIINSLGTDRRTQALLDKLDVSANQDFFLWHTWFKDVFDKGGFDIVIGNPPYINVENLDEKTKEYLFTNYSTCQGRTDIYIGFIEKSITLMNCKGVTSFIIPYSYTNQNYGELSRKMLTEKYSINEIVDTSNYYVFDNAVVKNIIIRFGRSKGDYTLIRIADNKECFEQANFGDRILPTKTFLQLKNCRIETKPFENIMGIKENIEKASIRLGKIYLVAYGVRVNNKYDKNKPKNYYIHDTPRAQYKKFTEGKCIDRYTFTQYGWLNYCPNEHYNSMFPELFENEKLMFINVVSKGLRFAYDNEGYYNSHTVVNCVNISKLTKVTHPTAKKAIKEGNVILAKNYSTKFVLGVINSKLMNWYFLQFQSEGLHCYPDDAKQFPIIKATPVQQQPIIDLVDQILEKKRDNPNANTSVLEEEIDKLVYQLYNLTPEEIAIIEQ